jgi:hypothetical protein
MRALWLTWVLLPLAGGCLSPDTAAYLPVRDDSPPSLKASMPTPSQVIERTSVLQVTFTEAMEPRSLRPGIGVFKGQEEVALLISPPKLREGETEVERGDVPFTVVIGPAVGTTWDANASYVLYLRKLLTDVEGNPLDAEHVIPFTTLP